LPILTLPLLLDHLSYLYKLVENRDSLNGGMPNKCHNYKGFGHKVLKYLECHSLCPLVGIGAPHSLSCKQVCTPPPSRTKGGGNKHTRLRVRGCRGGVSPNSADWRKRQALCLTLWVRVKVSNTVRYMISAHLNISSKVN
jgi:hypothetical protein